MLELSYDTMDDIPENMEGLYTEQEGKAVLTGINGMKTNTDISKLQESLRKERTDHSAVKKALKTWENHDYADVMAQLDRVKELEIAADGKLDDAKIQEMVESRLSQKTGPLERSLETLKTERDTLLTENGTLRSSMDTRDRNEVVRAVAQESKVHLTAMPDIEMAASFMLEKDDTGKLVSKSEIQGITPGLDVKGWLKEMQGIRTHWWPESFGSGANGASGGNGFGGTNPWSSKSWDLTQQGAVLKSQGAQVADRMAKTAGTTLGGLRPV
jgi:regulator of replication initiation timing